MNVEIGAEAALFPEKEYIKGIAVAVQVKCISTVVSTLPPPFSPLDVWSVSNIAKPYHLHYWRRHSIDVCFSPYKQNALLIHYSLYILLPIWDIMDLDPFFCTKNINAKLPTLMKKENQILFIWKEIQSGAVAKSYITNGLLIYRELFAHFLIFLGSPSSYMTLQLLHSEFPYIWGKFYFLFYQCTYLLVAACPGRAACPLAEWPQHRRPQSPCRWREARWCDRWGCLKYWVITFCIRKGSTKHIYV